jgi:hypothetical protein
MTPPTPELAFDLWSEKTRIDTIYGLIVSGRIVSHGEYISLIRHINKLSHRFKLDLLKRLQSAGYNEIAEKIDADIDWAGDR